MTDRGGDVCRTDVANVLHPTLRPTRPRFLLDDTHLARLTSRADVSVSVGSKAYFASTHKARGNQSCPLMLRALVPRSLAGGGEIAVNVQVGVQY